MNNIRIYSITGNWIQRLVIVALCLQLPIFNLQFSICKAQSDDIEVTDSTSTEWGGGGGGGLNPLEPDEPVTSLTLSQTTLTLEGGQKVRIVATVNARAKNKKIRWTSGNNDIATVNVNGTVTAWAVGTATITATAEGNTSLKATCQVTVTSDYVLPATGYLLPWGKDEPWEMKYQSIEFSMDPGDTSWTLPSYDDGKWPVLTGPIGNKGSYNYLWEGDYNGFQLRRDFILHSVDANALYTFYAIHDDDLWIYLNGELVGYFDDWSHDGVRSMEIPAYKFVKGKNILSLRIVDRGGRQYLDYALYRKTPRQATHVPLPNVPFEFYFNAQDYDTDDQLIPNHQYANLRGTSLQLTENLPERVADGKALRISDRCEGFLDKWEKGSNESGAYFYREGQDCMTIVTKVSPRLGTGNACDFISNRGGGYNYMWRIGDNNSMFLHTGNAYSDNRRLPLKNEQPQVLAVRVNGPEDYIILQNLTTHEQLRVDGVNWGGGNNVFKIFYNNGGEYFLGDFYWVYYSFELLTDAQLQTFMETYEDNLPVTISLNEGWNWVSQPLQQPLNIATLAGDDGQRVLSQTREAFNDQQLGWVGNLTNMEAGQAYKVLMKAPHTVNLPTAPLATEPIQLYKGWNWVGYNHTFAASLPYALQPTEAEEGDVLFSKSGFATFASGEWMGTGLDSLRPGQGYMYKSASKKQLLHSSERERIAASRTTVGRLATMTSDVPATWEVDNSRYSSQMACIAELFTTEGKPLRPQAVGAFCGGECRGISATVDDLLFISIGGEAGEEITLRALADDGTEQPIAETIVFDGDIHGSVTQPLQLHLSATEETEDIASPTLSHATRPTQPAYTLGGRRATNRTRGIRIGSVVFPSE